MVKTALLIGVSEYAAGLNPLPKAVDDIAAMKTVLEQSDLGGFTEVKVLPNPKPFEMQFEIEQLFAGRKKDDLIVLFFSGHGVKDDSGNLYFATSLTKKTPEGELIKSTAVPSRFIHDIMSNSRSRRQVVILDCCFSGAFAKGLSAKDDGSVPVKEQLGGEGRVVLTSSTATQYSFEEADADLSVYTRYLVEGITSGAADIDNDGMIGVEELHEYAKRKVHESSPAMKPKIYAVEEGFKILLTQSPVHDPKLAYRKEVEERTSQGKISAVGRKILDALKIELSISDEVAAEIEAAAVKPHEEYQAKLSTYQQVLKETLARESPLSAYARDELRRYQRVLGLRDQDVAPIKTQILGSPRPKSGPPNQELLQNEATNSTPIKNQFFSQPPNEIQEGTPVGQTSKLPLTSARSTRQENLESMPESASVGVATQAGPTPAPNTLLGAPPTKRRGNLSWLLASAVAIGVVAAAGGIYKLVDSGSKVASSGPSTPTTILTTGSGSSAYQKPPKELAIIGRIQALREEVPLPKKFFLNLVDHSFYEWNPGKTKQKLDDQSSEDEALRMEWLELGERWLTLLKTVNLSSEAVANLGQYELDEMNLEQKSQAVGIPRSAFIDLVDARFDVLFLGEMNKLTKNANEFRNNVAVGQQLWRGMAMDKLLPEVQSGKPIERIQVAVDGSARLDTYLEVGEGKIYTLELPDTVDALSVNLVDALPDTTKLSLYSPKPHGKNVIISDSLETTASTDSIQAGTYTIVVVSTSDKPINYQLTVSADPKPSEPAPSVNPLPIDSPSAEPTKLDESMPDEPTTDEPLTIDLNPVVPATVDPE